LLRIRRIDKIRRIREWETGGVNRAEDLKEA
jgi:hypothetical protein